MIDSPATNIRHTADSPGGDDAQQRGPGGIGGRSGQQLYVTTTAFVALFSIVGVALYGLPFFYDFMVKEFGWTRQQVTSGNAYSKLIVGPLFGFLAGWMVDRFGPRRLMIVGILMAGLALIGLGAMSTLTGFYIFYLFNALGYVFGGPLPNQVLLSRWFDRGRGKAMGIAYLGIGVGGTLVPLLANSLTTRFGWHTALYLLGLLMIALTLPFALFVKDAPPPASPLAPSPRETRVTASAASGAAASASAASAASSSAAAHSVAARAAASPASRNAQAVSLRAIFTHWTFPLLLVGSMCSIGAVGGTMQNLKLLLSLDRGFAQSEVAGVLSLVLASSIIGRLLMGWLADRWAKKHVMLLIYVIVSVAVPMIFWSPTPTWLRISAVLFGIGLGGDYMIIPLMAAELYGVAVLGRVMGVVLTADGVAEALAPMAVATIRDQRGTYEGGFLMLMALAAIGWLAVAFLPARPTGRIGRTDPDPTSASPAHTPAPHADTA
jgi:sugar phosphate permease